MKQPRTIDDVLKMTRRQSKALIARRIKTAPHEVFEGIVTSKLLAAEMLLRHLKGKPAPDVLVRDAVAVLGLTRCAMELWSELLGDGE